ncbi:MAG: hypothetical protein O2779_01920 [Nanoarchaeota archaeon]|nr:hypothetical protein [Nanoarchaeota archaeon]
MHCIIKVKGHQEDYNEKKVYKSIYAAALNCEYTEEKAKRIASDVTAKVTHALKRDVKKGACVGSTFVSGLVIDYTADRHVRLMYKHHMDIC